MDIADLSKKQISRLRNGHSVRVKRGKGHTVELTCPKKAKKMSACFAKNKGMNLSLSKEEIEMNGKGFLGINWKKTGKDISKGFRSVKRKVVAIAKKPEVANLLKKGLNTAADIGIDALATSASVYAPELAPLIYAGKGELKKSVKKSVDKGLSRQPRGQPKKSVKELIKEGVVDAGSAVKGTVMKGLMEYTLRQLEDAVIQKAISMMYAGSNPDDIEGNGLYPSGGSKRQGLMLGRGSRSMGMKGQINQKNIQKFSDYNVNPIEKYNI
jgi:hypothetical protein